MAGCIACEGIFTWAIIIEGSHLQGPQDEWDSSHWSVDPFSAVWHLEDWLSQVLGWLLHHWVDRVHGSWCGKFGCCSLRLSTGCPPVAHPVTPKGLGWPRVWSPLLRLVLPIPAFVLNEKTVNLRNATAHPYLFKPSHIFANDSEALIWGFELFSLSSSIELALILGFITVKAWQRFMALHWLEGHSRNHWALHVHLHWTALFVLNMFKGFAFNDWASVCLICVHLCKTHHRV